MPAEPSARVFFALWPSTAVADDLAGLAADLAASCGGRPTRAGTVHLTLAFVGNVAESRMDELAAAACGISLRAFDLRLDRRKPAFFPHVTLLRKVALVPPEKPLTPARDWHCQGFVLVRSQLSAAGADYRVLASYPFASGQTQA